MDEARAIAAQADSDYRTACAQRDTAVLDFERAQVRAPHNGIVANLLLHPGDYAVAGKAAMAMIDTDTFRVEGYFEETKVPRIRVGAATEITLWGWAKPLTGHVESIAPGIEDRERTDNTGELANIDPSYTWVRLAQRIPVRIAVDALPDGRSLVAGQSATVVVEP
ncbi:HlyD family efflux transporter periplasmic adaptor subunit [Rhizobium grahamii]|uniref:HlyD family efflux transporter periplasmic adaptor subunit n=1 Tax=Rhizobium grahamii TaxID=1120045 RepID=UPI000E0C4470|nr:HlyD family efflux transporter periplasmic adaptor subunit [Rhizobium grahamii]